MKRCISGLMVTLILLPSQYCCAQNKIKIIRSAFTRTPQAIERQIQTRIGIAQLGHRVGLAQQPDLLDFRTDKKYAYWVLERKVAEHTIPNPKKLYGPYGYLKTISSLTKKHKELVRIEAYHDWHNIQNVQGYNGVHHLISKSTIAMIHADLKQKGIKVSLSEMQYNAPSIFHPLHGHPTYQEVFHDFEQQYHDYNRFGMKITVISLLERIDEINAKLGFPLMKERYLEGILSETELWCRTYGLNY